MKAPLSADLVAMARLGLGLSDGWPEMNRREWIGSAERHGVLPLIAARARALGIDWLAKAARDVVLRTHAALAVHEREAARAFAALRDADVDAVSFKGFSVGRRAYEEDGTRPIRDVDVLVRSTDFHRAVDVVSGLGFRPLRPANRPVTFEMADSWMLVAPTGAGLDLHRAVARPRVFPLDYPLILDRTLPGVLPGERWLDATDELHLTCLHHQKHCLRPTLVQILDAVRLARRLPPEWDRLVSDARRWRTATAVWVSLCWVRAIDPRCVPEDVVATLSPSLPRARAIALALDRLGPTPGDDASPSRAHQALVYALTTRARDLVLDSILHAKERIADRWSSRAGLP